MQLDDLTSDVPPFFADLNGQRDQRPSLLDLINPLQNESLASPSDDPQPTVPGSDVDPQDDFAGQTVRKRKLPQLIWMQNNRLATMLGLLTIILAGCFISSLTYSKRVISGLKDDRDALLKTVENVVFGISGKPANTRDPNPYTIQKRALTTSIDGLDQVTSLTHETKLLEAQFLFRLAGVAYRTEDLETAISSLDRCIERLNDIQEDQKFPTPAMDTLRCLSLLRGRAVVCRAMVWLKQGFVDPARTELDLELNVSESLPVNGPQELPYLIELAHGCVALGKQLDDFQKAERYLVSTIELAKKATTIIDGHSDAASFSNELLFAAFDADTLRTIALTELAERKYTLDHADAPRYDYLLHQQLVDMAPCDDTLESVDRLIRQEEGNAKTKITADDYWDYALEVVLQSDLSRKESLRNVALCYEMIASLKQQKFDFEQARNAYQSALEFRNKLCSTDSCEFRDFQAIIDTRLQLAQVLRSIPGRDFKSEVKEIEREVSERFEEDHSAKISKGSRRWYSRVHYALQQLSDGRDPTSGDDDS